jgi:hypothetical protein
MATPPYQIIKDLLDVPLPGRKVLCQAGREINSQLAKWKKRVLRAVRSPYSHKA